MQAGIARLHFFQTFNYQSGKVVQKNVAASVGIV